jgi:hypothetical protein
MSNNRRHRNSPVAARLSRTPATIASLSAELLRLSSHPDDGIASTADYLRADLAALGPSPSAQQFEGLYRNVFSAHIALSKADLSAWRAAHGIARAVLVGLVRAHKTELQRRRKVV